MENFKICSQCSVKLYKGPVGKKNETVKILDVNVELCKFFQRFSKGDPFTSYYMKILKNYGKVITSCPMKVVRVPMFLNLKDSIKS